MDYRTLPEQVLTCFSGMAMDLMTQPEVIKQFQQIHVAIYKGFVSFENIQKCDDPTLDTQWSENYKDWMDKFLQKNQNIMADKVGTLSQSLSRPEITGTNGQKNAFGKAADAMALTYGSDVIAKGSLTLQRDKLLSLPPRTTLGILRRDDVVCSSTSSTTASTTAATSTPPPPPPPPSSSPTVCPAPGPHVNLQQNRCDQKCMGKGWGKCEANEPGTRNHYSCYCNDGPCGGMECGDPVKIDNLTKKGTKCPVSLQSHNPRNEHDTNALIAPG